MPSALPQVIFQLREGKAALRRDRRGATLEEKLRQLVQAQHLYVQVVGSQRPLKSWQRPWNILSDVKESVVKPVGYSRSHWIRVKPQSL